MKKIMLFFVLGLMVISCVVDKENLPSGSPDKVLSEELYNQLSSKYDSIADFRFGYAIVKQGKYGLIDYQGNEILECIYEDIFDFNDDAKIIKKGGKFGFIKYNGEIIEEAKYDDFRLPDSYIDSETNNTLIALKSGSKWGVFLPDGKNIIPFDYTDIINIENGYVVAENNNKYGILDSLGNIKIDFKYDDIFFHYRRSNISLVKKDNCIGLVNSKMELVTECEYNCEFLVDGLVPTVDAPCNGYIRLQKFKASSSHPELCGLINCETGEIAIPFEYDDLGAYSEGLIWAKKDDKYGYIDINNHVVLKFEYDRAYDFSEGMAAVEKYTGKLINLNMGIVPDRRTGFINKYGKVVIPFQYNTQIGNDPFFREGLAPITISNDNFYGKHCGYINKDGDFIIKPIYDKAEPFEKGLGQVCLNDKYGYLDKTGKIVIPIEFDFVTICHNGNVIAHKKEGDKTTFEFEFDKKGKLISSKQFDY